MTLSQGPIIFILFELLNTDWRDVLESSGAFSVFTNVVKVDFVDQLF